jgi:hypothetical protein
MPSRLGRRASSWEVPAVSRSRGAIAAAGLMVALRLSRPMYHLPLRSTAYARAGGTTMKVGILTWSVDVALAQRSETLGFDSFWVPEHTGTSCAYRPKNHHLSVTSRTGRDSSSVVSPRQVCGALIALARASAVTQTIAGDGRACARAPSDAPGQAGRHPDNFSAGRFLWRRSGVTQRFSP